MKNITFLTLCCGLLWNNGAVAADEPQCFHPDNYQPVCENGAKNCILVNGEQVQENLSPLSLFSVLSWNRLTHLGDKVEFVQQSQTCTSCKDEGDDGCISVNGKRIDSGDSLGAISKPPTNTEQELEQPTWRLVSPKEVEEKEVEKIVIVQHRRLKQVIDSTIEKKFGYGKSDLTPSLKDDLAKFAAKIKSKENLQITIAGHTDSHTLSLPKRKIYGDNFGLGKARAENAGSYIAEQLEISSELITIQSYGAEQPISDNKTNEGRAQNRRIEIFVVYDQPEIIEAQKIIKVMEPVIPPPIRSCADVLASSRLSKKRPFRISIDGVPIEDTGVIDADIQRCTDLALEKTDIQVRYDDLELSPWLNVSATPNSAVRGEDTVFRVYSNYDQWITKTEIRLFSQAGSLSKKPLAVIPVGETGRVVWKADSTIPATVRYLVRVYDENGSFDETVAKLLRIDHKAKPLDDSKSAKAEELIGYGENSLRMKNIPLHGGAVAVNGDDIPQGSRVLLFGKEIPVDSKGSFASRQILPSGHHVVDLKVVGKKETLLFERNLYIPYKDWFYIGIGDLTVGENRTSGPAQLVTGDSEHYNNEIYVDGRLAFYLKGKIKGKYLLTAAADTQEQPIEDLFSNFDAKDPRSLLRRLDPDLYYPVYGDDSTTIDDAPTSGKFYVKLARGDSHIMWGNFKTRWVGSDFAKINRGMYGGNIHWESEKATEYGERKAEVDLFAGDPGTLGARDDFRGTGGSLYNLRHLDITMGSESIWVEVRDKDSGIVLQTTPLVAGEDYDINSIQGRLLLTSPLPSTANDSQLVRAGALSGHPVYLLATYEYTPGITEVDNLTVGGRGQVWLNDHIQLGAAHYEQGNDASELEIQEVDATLRYKPGTYIKAEVGRSNGSGESTSSSLSGGYEFTQQTSPGDDAIAVRVEAAVDLAEISDGKGTIAGYYQKKEKGFSGPGQLTAEDTEQYGAVASIDVTENITLDVKTDLKETASQDTLAASGTGRIKVTENLNVSAGVRYDDRDTKTANQSPTDSQSGKRTDLAVEVEYTPGNEAENTDWSLYGFGQVTLDRTGDRDENNRYGIGGRYKLFDPVNVSGEISDGTGGIGGKAGVDWRVNERSQLYMNYSMDTDRTDHQYRGRQGKFTTGGSTRYSDSLTVYGEERLLHGDGPSGLIHAFGLDLAASDSWNFGFLAESGTLIDGDIEDVEHTALSFSAGYAEAKTRYAGNLEWREDDGTDSGERTSWLMRNSLGYQTSDDWRFLGKLNFGLSDSDRGDFFNADFVEASLGYAYRPVFNDRFNALFKYTYFYDLPSADSLTGSSELPDYAQRSHVISIDTIYDLYPWLSVGGKYGFRLGELKDSRVDGTWFSSDAHLGIVRADMHFVHDWDAVIEGRYLTASEAQDEQYGALAAVYRHVTPNIKVGAGYNFTDFSDDLTDLDHDSYGWFFNITGKF